MPLRPPPPPLRLSSRPLVGAAAALAVGVVAQRAVGTSPLAWLAVVGAVVLSVTLYGVATRRRLVTLRRLAVTGGALLAVAALGALRQGAWETLPPDHVAHLAGEPDADPVALWATVAETPSARRRSVKLALDVDSVGTEHRAPASGRVLVSLGLPWEGDASIVYPALRLGDRVRVDAVLEPPPTPRNPADFDYGAYLRGQGIWATAFVREAEAVTFVGPADGLLDRVAAAVQRHVRTQTARHVASPDAQGVLLALLLGDRSAVGQGALDAFRETGLMHLLAVSGLHVLLVGMGLFALLKPVLGRLGWRRRTVDVSRAAVTLAILGLYVLVTGGSVSVVRAFVMAAVWVGGVAMQRKPDALNSLGLATIVLLLMRPTALWDVGFQLSFGAVAALVTLVPILETRIPGRFRSGTVGYVTDSVLVSLVATLGTAPALLVHFGRVALGGLVLNLPAIPLTAATLGAGIGTSVLGSVPVAGRAFGAVADASASLLLWTSRVGADGLGGVAIDGFLDRPLTVLAVVLGLATLALARRPTARLRTATLAVGCLALGAFSAPPAGLDVVFLDVGQGDATLVTTPDGSAVLVDAGVKTPFSDQGERTVVPHLERFGIDRLDALVLTHADADHIGGAAAVLRAVPVGRLVTNGHGGDTRMWRALRALADSLGVPTVAASAGDTLAVDPAVRVRVLGPARRHGSANEASVVLHVTHGATRWLLSGDAEHDGEADLVQTYGDALAADVVKVGHHGSRTSSTPALVAAAGAPQFAVVSVAAENRYGLPDQEPLMRWLRAGALVLQTADHGAVWLRSDGAGVTRVDWRAGAR